MGKEKGNERQPQRRKRDIPEGSKIGTVRHKLRKKKVQGGGCLQGKRKGSVMAKEKRGVIRLLG